MILTAIFNAILAIGVTVMVVAPLVWAIVTQHRDHARLAAADVVAAGAYQRRAHRRVRRARYPSVQPRALRTR